MSDAPLYVTGLPAWARPLWREAVLKGGPYRDPLPPVSEPCHDILDALEGNHILAARRRQRVAAAAAAHTPRRPR